MQGSSGAEISTGMARRISVFDWSTTALGEKATWPQSLKTAVDIMLGCGFPAALWAGDRSVTLYNDAYAALLNGRDDLGGAGLGALEPASAPLASAIEESWRGKALTFEDQPLLFPGEQSADGRRFTLSCSPVRDEVGAVAAVLVILSETTERAHAGQSLNLMVAELQHRVRNILAVIRSIVSRSAETSDTVEDLSAHLDGRLAALARTQVLLTRSPGAGVDLESLIRDELLAQVADEDRIVIEGPEVLLHPKAAEVMTLAVHELATNATKYGALATALGHIDIGWTVGEGGWIDFKWRESGVKVAAAAPRRVGFGSVLVEQRVPYELMGTGALAFAPGGVQCEISFPLTPIPSVLQSDARER